MSTQRAQLIQLIEQGAVPHDRITDALTATNVRPNADAWRMFVNQLLLWLGVLAVSMSVLFFIAFNWDDLGRFAKFGLVQLLIVAAVLIYWKKADDSLIGKASLLAATIFLGVLLALYGQTYQTGADPWQLFFNWALLMLPWAFVARFAAIWVLWLALLNLSMVLYYHAFRGFLWIPFYRATDAAWLIFVFNTAALLIWEYLARSHAWLAERWAVRLVALGSGIPITWLVINGIFDPEFGGWLPGIIWFLWVAVVYWVYRRTWPDLFMLAGLCLSGIVVVISFFAKHVINENYAGSFLFLSFLIIAMGSGAAVWLRNVHKEIQA